MMSVVRHRYESPARYRLRIWVGRSGRTIEVNARRLAFDRGRFYLDGQPIVVDGYEVTAWRQT